MNSLKVVLDKLRALKGNYVGSYFIPETWNAHGFTGYTTVTERPGEINVNPYDFMISTIESCFLSGKETEDALVPLGCRRDSNALDISKSVIYGMFPRMLTAWDHAEKNKVYSGTLLKAICYLPYLKKLDVDIVYLLPFFDYSNRNKKGELGSPYSIKNIYKPDRNLHDFLLGDFSDELLALEFKAFVEACHLLGIRVMVDFVFRSVSRENDLIKDHPEWFYWIGYEHDKVFSAPLVDKEKSLTLLTEKTLPSLYSAKGIHEYLSWFTFSPNILDSAKWELLVKKHEQTGENLLGMIESEFGITTAPGFSDVLNDPQPAWSDVTFLKFFHDTHEKALSYTGEGHPPHILQDGIRLNLFPGEKPIEELWEYVAGAIPYYQKEYGIDGARIDMGHALPTALNQKIVQNAKANNKNFILWSEEFHVDKSQQAQEDGFHFISGFMYFIFKELEKSSFNKNMLSKTLMKSVLPIAAALETPDTPRVALVHGDMKKLEMLAMINCFLPNTIQFINNGFEVMEIQPMNLGLDNTEEGRFVLDPSDSMYGKLAFFDNYKIHWLNQARIEMDRILNDAFMLRRQYIEIISRKENFVNCNEKSKNKRATFLLYFDRKQGKGAYLLANRDFKAGMEMDLNKILPEDLLNSEKFFGIAYGNFGKCNTSWPKHRKRRLKPGEVLVGWIE